MAEPSPATSSLPFQLAAQEHFHHNCICTFSPLAPDSVMLNTLTPRVLTRGLQDPQEPEQVEGNGERSSNFPNHSEQGESRRVLATARSCFWMSNHESGTVRRRSIYEAEKQAQAMHGAGKVAHSFCSATKATPFIFLWLSVT